MGKIWKPLFSAGQRVLFNGRPATVLKTGLYEGSMIILFDDCPDDEYYHCHETFLAPLVESQPAKDT
jgi:hypothetical protein